MWLYDLILDWLWEIAGLEKSHGCPPLWQLYMCFLVKSFHLACKLFQIPSNTSCLFIFKPSNQEFPLRKCQNKRHIWLPWKATQSHLISCLLACKKKPFGLVFCEKEPNLLMFCYLSCVYPIFHLKRKTDQRDRLRGKRRGKASDLDEEIACHVDMAFSRPQYSTVVVLQAQTKAGNKCGKLPWKTTDNKETWRDRKCNWCGKDFSIMFCLNWTTLHTHTHWLWQKFSGSLCGSDTCQVSPLTIKEPLHYYHLVPLVVKKKI